jgi:transposase
VAVTVTSAIDDPARSRHARAVGAHLGLTPRRYQSGETDVTGGIGKVGDAMVRTALDEAANAMLIRSGKLSVVKRLSALPTSRRGIGDRPMALEVATRRGMRRAKVALARKLAIVLHRLWADGSALRFGQEAAVA